MHRCKHQHRRFALIVALMCIPSTAKAEFTCSVLWHGESRAFSKPMLIQMFINRDATALPLAWRHSVSSIPRPTAPH